MNKFFRSDTSIGLVLALAAFAVYLATLAPGVLEEDRGELAAALYTMGITHPTGYPLFTLIGWVFAHLPLGDVRVIWKLNLMVALFCAAAAFLFHRLFLHLLREGLGRGWGVPVPAPARRKQKPGNDDTAGGDADNRLAAAAATLVLAFSRIYWSNALALEVYALHLLFLGAVTLLFLRAMRENPEPRAWPLFAYVLGLSFANHMMTVLLAPAFLYLYFTAHGFGKAAWTRIIRVTPPFLLGLTPYLYLPLRAARKPLMNWGDPSTWEAFWRHVSGEQYRFMMFSSFEGAVKKLGEFFASLPADFGYLPLAVALTGLWFLFRRSRKMLAFSLLLFLGCLFYAVNYGFNDPNFHLNAHFAVAVWVLWGVKFLLGRSRSRGARAAFAGAACAVLVLAPLAANYRAVDQSQNHTVEDYVKNTFASIEYGGFVLSGQYDYLTMPACYLQLVEGVRPDIALVEEALLKRPWYHVQLEQRHPRIVRGARHETAKFLEANARLENRRRASDAYADSVIVWEYYAALIGTFFRDSYAERPLYVTSDVTHGAQSGVLLGLTYVPTGMVFRLLREMPPQPLPYLDFALRPFPVQSRKPRRGLTQYEYIRNNYAQAYANQGFYRLNLGDSARAGTMLRKALELRPGFPEAAAWLNVLRERGY